MIARREGNRAYLDALAAEGHDLDRIVRHLDWNMLNQVYVFGYFHADLHPANLFVLRATRSATWTSGSSGSSPTASATR